MASSRDHFNNASARGYSGSLQGDSSSYFTEFTFSKALLYLCAAAYVFLASIVALAQPFLTIPCERTEAYEPANPAFDSDTCRQQRFTILLGLTPEECQFGRSLVTATILGGVIGWERRQADRPAGIRTMSLVSLGSCLFTINSAFAFLNGPMTWDSSRVSAAIPSGVGFLGAGLIFKKEEKANNGESSHVVTGLTTAASLWLSAAVGIACGGELYFAASFGTCIMMLLLRFGPRSDDKCDDDDDDEEEDQLLEQHLMQSSYSSETQPLNKNSTRSSGTRQSISGRQSMRQRAALASTV